MTEKSKAAQNETLKNRKETERPRQRHTPEGPAEEFIDEYNSRNNPPPQPQRKK